MAVKTHIKIINKQSGDYLLNIYSLYSREHLNSGGG
jgi:hypothetical protein